MRLASRPAAAAAAVSLTLGFGLAGCGGGSGTGSAQDDPAQLVPAGSPDALVAEVGRGTPARKAAFAFADRVAPGDRDLEALLARVLDHESSGGGGGARFSQDIDPQLGDRVAVFVDDFTPHDVGGAAILSAHDPQKLLAALENGEAVRSRGTYRGASYRVLGDGAVDGIVEGFVVGAADLAHFRAVADAAAGRSIADVPAFADARDDAGEDPLAFGYADVAKVLDRARAADPRAARAVAAVLGADHGTVTLSARVEDERAVIEVHAPAGGAPVSAPAVPLAALPGDTWLAAAVSGLGQALRSGVVHLDLPGLDLRRDVLSWLGSATAYLHGSGLAVMGAGAILTTSDPERSRAALPRIAAVIAALAGGDVRRSAGGYTVALDALPPISLRQTGRLVQATFGSGSSSGELGDTALYRRAKDALDGLTPQLLLDGDGLAGLLRLAGVVDAASAHAARYADAFDTVAAGSETSDGRRTIRLAATLRSGS